MPTNEAIERELAGAAVLSAALRTGLLTYLVESGGTPAEVARALELDERAVTLVTNALCVLGFAARDGERVRASDDLHRYVARTSLGLPSMRVWAHVEPFLTGGEPLMRSDGDLGERGRLYQQAVSGLGERWRESAEQLADRFDPIPREILDIGAGSGVWSLAVAARSDTSRVTALDLPDVLERFDAHATARALADRTAHLPGGWFDVEVPEERFDLVLLANVLHLERAPEARALLQRAARGVKPGGRMAIVDAISDQTPEMELKIALYALHLGMRTEGGTPHPRDALERWLREAGLELESYHRLAASAALVASRPA